MASESRTTGSTLKDRLFAESYRFRFFQAVRLLEKLRPKQGDGEARPDPANRDAMGVGQDANPDEEVVRFRAHPSLEFPPSPVYEITGQEDGPAEMVVAFMGLTGPLGVLPRHYTELVIEGKREKEPALSAFLDMFNHRLISLFYRAWEKYRLEVAFEKGERDHFSRYLMSLIGLGTPGLQNRLSLNDKALLPYTGMIAQQPRSVCALESLLQNFFGLCIEIQQFGGQWFKLDESSRSTLGQKGRNNRLGVSTVIGEKVWDRQAKFTVRIGAMGYAKFVDFLPQGKAYRAANELVRLFAGQEFDFALQLVLKKEEVPECQLGGDEQSAPKLGWSTWLMSQPPDRDVDDVLLDFDDRRLTPNAAKPQNAKDEK